MKKVSIVLMLILSTMFLHGCAAGSATAGYAMRAGTADELKADARESIIKEAVARCQAKYN